MGGVIRRLAPDSKDESLEIIEYMEILHILEEYPSIERIILTSSSGKSSALGWFKGYLEKNRNRTRYSKRDKAIKISDPVQQTKCRRECAVLAIAKSGKPNFVRETYRDVQECNRGDN